MAEIPANKFEKEKRVIELHVEGKTIREIAPIVHMSFRDISKKIKAYEKKVNIELKENTNSSSQKIKKASISSLAFTLFKEGKKLDEIKVLLDIPFRLALRYWKQYLKSIRMYECLEFYEIWQYDLPSLLSISSFMKRNNLSGIDILNVLRTANNIINLNQYYSNLKTDINRLEWKRMNLSYYSHSSSYSLQPLPLNKPKYNYYSY